jgi:hypothetical protein
MPAHLAEGLDRPNSAKLLKRDASPEEEWQMPATKAKPKPKPKPAPAARKSRPAEHREQARASAIERTTELSEDVLQSVESGQRAAIEAVRKFVDTVDQALPPGGAESSRRQDVVDAAMEMADRLVHTQYDFLRKVVHGAGQSLTRSDGK